MSESRDLTPAGGREVTERPAMAGPMFEGRRSLGPGAAIGAISVESERAIAEAQAAMIVAQSRPRHEMGAYAKIQEVCKLPSFAAQALYSYKRGGSTITGPSIRMAEELARCWGNFQYGMLELSQHDGSSEYQAFAHDLETNVRTYQNFTVNHIRDSGSGSKQLTDQRDIYEIGANNGARRMRARILALLPAWYVDDAVQAVEKTRAERDKDRPISEIIRGLAAYAQGMGVTTAMLEARLGHPLEQTQPAEIQTLRGVFTAIKDQQTTIADEFPTNAGAAGDPIVKAADPDKKPTTTKAKPPETKPAEEKPKEEAKQQAAPPAEEKPQEKPQEAQPQAQAATQAEQSAPAAQDPPGGPEPTDMF